MYGIRGRPMQALWIPPVLEAVWNAPLFIQDNTLFAARRAVVTDKARPVCFVECPGMPFLQCVLRDGVTDVMNRLCAAQRNDTDPDRREARRRLAEALEGTLALTGRYMALACELEETACEEERARLHGIRKVLERVPERGAQTLREAVQSYLMVTEAFEVENGAVKLMPAALDRLFEPYRAQGKLARKAAAALFADALGGYPLCGGLVVGGRDASGNDLSNKTSMALLDAFSETPGARVVLRRHKGVNPSLLRAVKKIPGARYIDDDKVFACAGFSREAALWHVFLPEAADDFWQALEASFGEIGRMRQKRETPLVVALLGDVESCQTPRARVCLVHGLEAATRGLTDAREDDVRERVAGMLLEQTGLEAAFPE